MVEFEKFPRNSPAFLIVYKSYPGWPSRWSRKNKNLPQAPRFNFMDYVNSPGERQFWKKREQWITSQPKHDHHGDEHFQNINMAAECGGM